MKAGLEKENLQMQEEIKEREVLLNQREKEFDEKMKRKELQTEEDLDDEA